eukprot:scaffold15821_cov56-Attheya_sp.AAC.5
MAILTMIMAGEDEEVHYSTGETTGEDNRHHSYDDSYIYSEDDESESDFSGLIRNFWGEEREEYDNTSSEESEEDQDQDDSREKRHCVMCLQKKKSMVLLPCCGSTNQFCESCMIKYLQSQQTPDTYADPYCEPLVGACPPCCKLIFIRTQTDESPFAISKATFQQSIGYALRTGDSQTRIILRTAAYVNPNFMPLELLGEDTEAIRRRLCTWNILQKSDSGEVYTMDRCKQLELRDLITRKSHAYLQGNNNDFEDDHTNLDETKKKCLDLVSKLLFIAAQKSYAKFRLITSLRLLYRGVYLGFQVRGIFPLNHSPLEWWQEAIVAILYIFLVIALPTIIFTTYCAIQLASFILRIKPQHIKSGCMIILAIVSYRHKEFLINMGYRLFATCTSLKPLEPLY